MAWHERKLTHIGCFPQDPPGIFPVVLPKRSGDGPRPPYVQGGDGPRRRPPFAFGVDGGDGPEWHGNKDRIDIEQPSLLRISWECGELCTIRCPWGARSRYPFGTCVTAFRYAISALRTPSPPSAAGPVLPHEFLRLGGFRADRSARAKAATECAACRWRRRSRVPEGWPERVPLGQCRTQSLPHSMPI